jgi:hypothetical protein
VKERVADPFRDLDVIDSRAPRFTQATIGLLAALAVAAAWWWLLGLLGLQLVVGLTLGRRFCAGCEAYKLGSLFLGRPFVSCPLPPQPARNR